MAARARNAGFHVTTAPLPERLPPAIAIPLIAGLSLGCWYVVWQVGAAIARLAG